MCGNFAVYIAMHGLQLGYNTNVPQYTVKKEVGISTSLCGGKITDTITTMVDLRVVKFYTILSV